MHQHKKQYLVWDIKKILKLIKKIAKKHNLDVKDLSKLIHTTLEENDIQ